MIEFIKANDFRTKSEKSTKKKKLTKQKSSDLKDFEPAPLRRVIKPQYFKFDNLPVLDKASEIGENMKYKSVCPVSHLDVDAYSGAYTISPMSNPFLSISPSNIYGPSNKQYGTCKPYSPSNESIKLGNDEWFQEDSKFFSKEEFLNEINPTKSENTTANELLDNQMDCTSHEFKEANI